MAAKKSSKSVPVGVHPPQSRHLGGYLAWGLLAGVWIMVTLALATYDPADPIPEGWAGGSVAPFNDPIHNVIGQVGAALAHKVYLMLGLGVWVFIAGSFVFLAACIRGTRISQPVLRLIGLILMTIATSAILGMTMPVFTDRTIPHSCLIAYYVNTHLTHRFNTIGAMIMLGMVFWVGAILAIDQVVMAIPRMVTRAFHLVPQVRSPLPMLAARLPRFVSATSGAGAQAGNPVMEDDGAQDEDAAYHPRTLSEAHPEAALPGDTTESTTATATRVDGSMGEAEVPVELDEPVNSGDELPEMDEVGSVASSTTRPPTSLTATATPTDPIATTAAIPASSDATSNAADQARDNSSSDSDTGAPADADAAADAPGAYLAEKSGGAFDPDALRARIRKLPIHLTPRAMPKLDVPGGAMNDVDMSGYQFPGLDILIEPEGTFSAEIEMLVKDQAVVLEMALKQYGIDGEVVGMEPGPVITLYDVRLAAGTKVNAVNAVASDLARALKAQNIRVVPNTAGKDTVAIEVPNLKKEKVRLKELMNSSPDIARMKLPMFLGKDASGAMLVQDLASMPHMLIAGTTGSGKSVCMNSIIMSFLLTKRPDELRLVLVDPKMVEMSMFKDLPHLMCPVVTEMSKAAAILEWATTKMDERYEILAEAGVRDIAGYNGLTWEELKERFKPATEAEEARVPKKLPYMVFVIDELADLMMTNKEVEGFIVRLAQKARAVGIHLILATQRPQANVVTGLIKGNMPCRVSFKVASKLDSRIVLDTSGAELLLGQGDMLFLSPRSSKLIRAQGTLVDDGEIRKAVTFLKDKAQQNFEPQLVQIKSAGVGDVDEDAAKDPLFDDAVRVVLESKRGSVSLLQRRLTIGYSRASRLIEAMAASGILGDYKNAQAREVSLTIEEWDAMKAQAAKDAAAAEVEGKTRAVKEEEFDPNAEDEASPSDDDSDDDGVPDEMDGEHKM